MFERIEKDYGTLVLYDGEVYDYEGGETENGFVYKDYEAFKSGKGICYISEFGLAKLHEALVDLESRYENITDPDNEDFIGDKEYEEDREDILSNCGETRESIIRQIRDAFGEDYMLTDKQIEHLAESVFDEVDWISVSSFLTSDFWLEDDIIFYEGAGIFTRHQHEAIMYGMTPKVYADRCLSYGELAELDEEFDEAFIVDEDCPDDWSDEGLGDNARITYVERRRTGEISGPDEFDCPERFRK